jgi:hypothetical protein
MFEIDTTSLPKRPILFAAGISYVVMGVPSGENDAEPHEETPKAGMAYVLAKQGKSLSMKSKQEMPLRGKGLSLKVLWEEQDTLVFVVYNSCQAIYYRMDSKGHITSQSQQSSR